MRQITVRVPEDLYQDLVEIKDRDQHSMDKAARILLQNAVKERKRKRRSEKPGN